MKRAILLTTTWGALLLAGCSPSGDETDGAKQMPAQSIAPDAATIAGASQLVPANAELAAKYDRSCRTCHSTPDAAAPLTGHKAAWDQRFATKGEAGLLASTKSGLNAMPAMGLCNDCSDDEFNRLIAFMAGRDD